MFQTRIDGLRLIGEVASTSSALWRSAQPKTGEKITEK